MSVFYKVLNESLRSMYGGIYQWTLGEWAPEVPIAPCRSGYHVCQESDLIYWLGPVIAECEVGRAVRHVWYPAKTVTDRCRIVRVLETWNERTQRLFACDCAEDVLPLYECKHPLDDRLHKAIKVARAYAVGEASMKELRLAYIAADDAAEVARGRAASAAADAAVYAASAPMADAAVRSAADNAAWAAAYAEAEGTFVVAGKSTAWAAERQWQTQRLFQYLRGEI